MQHTSVPDHLIDTVSPSISADTSAGGVTLEQISLSVTEHFEDLQDDWYALETIGICTPYQRYDWMRLWQAHVGVAHGIRPLLIKGEHAGRVLFILPLGLRQHKAATIAQWLGGKHVNFNMALYHPDIDTICPGLNFRSVLRRAAAFADVHIDLFALLNQPLHWQRFANPMSRSACQISASHSPFGALQPTFEAMLKEPGRKRVRKKIRSQQNKLKPHGGHISRQVHNPAEMHAVLDLFAQQKAQRFAELGIANVFDEPGVMSFFHSLIDAPSPSGLPNLELYVLEVAGDIRAIYAGAVQGQRFSGFFNSMAHDDLLPLALGDLLLSDLVAMQCERGLTSLDLGIGEARYKQTWCKERIELCDSFVGISMRGEFIAAVERIMYKFKRKIKQTPWLWNRWLQSRKAILGAHAVHED